MFKKLATLLAGITLMFASGNAMATPMLTLDDGQGHTVTVVDGNVGDVNGATGAITAVALNLGDWTINVSTGITGAVPGLPSLDLNSVNTSSKAAALTITYTDTITGVWTGPGASTHVGGTLNVTNGNNTALFETFINGGSYSIMQFGNPLISFSGDDAFSYTSTGNDTISLVATLIHSGAGSTSFDYAINPVPEPGTMVLLGAGMLGLAIFGKRRMNREA